MSRPRFELRTFCVLDRCDNQLRHRPMWYSRLDEPLYRKRPFSPLPQVHSLTLLKPAPKHYSTRITSLFTTMATPTQPAGTANAANIITALGAAFKTQNGDPLPGERIAQLLLQNMPQLSELAKQGKLNQQQIIQVGVMALSTSGSMY